MPEQLILKFPIRTAFGRDDFFVTAANAEAADAMEGWRAWAGGKLALSGPEGAGKTHLAKIWADLVGGTVVCARDLPHTDLPALTRQPIAVEDVPGIAGDRPAEEALFHLHNLAAENRKPLLLTGRDAPVRWGIGLPDLASRIAAARAVTLGAPDDGLLSAILVKSFEDRQLRVDPNLLSYILPRMERSFVGAQRLVAALDARALQAKQPLTRALARRVIEELETSP